MLVAAHDGYIYQGFSFVDVVAKTPIAIILFWFTFFIKMRFAHASQVKRIFIKIKPHRIMATMLCYVKLRQA